ncbi:hypothetical protein C8Q74DRAFT_1272578 [Fomes fomentarius]|nr:hypothetical protein C8Q74DRAFT_1272578 [Fomes fomentarius]
MSLSSLLLPGSKGKGKAIDKGLDELFRSNVSAAPPRQPAAPTHAPKHTAAPTPEKKRKATEDALNVKAKRSKSEAAALDTPSSSKAPKASKQKPAEDDSDDSEDEDEEDDEEEGEDEDEDEERTGQDAEDDEDDEGDPSRLVHESLLKGGEKGKKGQSKDRKTKHPPSDESPTQRDARTVFVGNVAIEVTKSRPTQKQFKRHLLSFVPSAKIESVRFRSVAFKSPTSELPTGDDGKSKPNPNHKSREHDRDRAASWRNEDKDEAAAAPAKRFLTPKEKKRVAFIKHDIHDQVDAVNAYVVFAHTLSPELLAARPANVPPPAPVMDPYEAARTCTRKCDGSAFLGRTLRVDVVKPGAGADEGESAGRSESAMAGDPKATVFVGSLEFTSKEEDLRAFFEALVCEERGKPGENKNSDESDDDDDKSEREENEEGKKDKDAKKSRTWVKRVRIIRDRDTQLGKGFAYVQFVDRECVDEILALDQSKLKFAKRKLRVQRCKTMPGGPKLRAAKPTRPSAPAPSKSTHLSSKAPHGNARPAHPPRLVPDTKRIPKGDPELGAKLAHLPKEERKKAKAVDADRVARRLAKKRAKALAEKGVKPRVDRERVRKRPGEKGAFAKGQGKDAKPRKRVRSGKALAKMNTKK